MKQPEISVIITVFNGEKFIGDSIKSILAQTYKKIELIIVDDGSTDNTIKEIESFDDKRIHMIKAGRVGRGRALNIGLSNSRGEYIAIQDADDFSHPQRLELQQKIMSLNPHISVLGTRVRRIFGEEKLSWKTLPTQKTIDFSIEEVSSKIIYYNPIMHSSVLMKKKILEQVNGYSEQRTNLFDYDLYIRIVAAGGSCWNMTVAPLVSKRLHDKQYFEKPKRFYYVTSSVTLQYKAMKLCNKKKFILALPFIFLYRFLPLKWRMAIREIIKK